MMNLSILLHTMCSEVLISHRPQAFTVTHWWYPSCFGVITISVQLIVILKFL